ncbi:MAG: acyl-CoA dehydrogenase, partial [Rhodospirillales bacterium]|nr:acyl-CoA dehydrogenase [Rhodospirillales bacterium]
IDRESIQLMMGDAALRLQICRLLVANAAWKLDQGDFAKKEVSAAKVYVSEALTHAIDTAIQVCGAKGYSKDTLLEWMYRYARQGRILDGASEVHKMIIARELFDANTDFWKWGA